MDSNEEVELPTDINLIRFGIPEIVTRETQAKQVKTLEFRFNYCCLLASLY
jgi:hypothetical protein